LFFRDQASVIDILKLRLPVIGGRKPWDNEAKLKLFQQEHNYFKKKEKDQKSNECSIRYKSTFDQSNTMKGHT